ncbi:hypothetical protein ACFV9C_32560 [Kribbella sp. NPDC059898]|uniref:hypothetical protein n=1 Tax=Kribbella sp. NPDC059898 TaxID=3346995 RepID=UPI0036465956
MTELRDRRAAPTVMLDRSESALGIVLGSRFYRSAFLSLLVAGIGVSSATPQLTLFLVRELHTPLPVAGTIGGIGVAAIGLPHVFFVPAGLTALAVAGFAVLGASDVGRERRQ